MPASPPRQTSSEPVYPEHQRLVSGQGCYVGDIALAEALVVTFVRAPLAHGRIRSVDVQAARAAPGVVAVYTGADVAGIGPLPVNPVLAQVAVPPYPILAGDEILAVGQPVVAIVADSVQAGADAADLVELDIDDQTPVLPRLRAGSDAADVADATGEAPSPALAQRWSEGDLAAAFDAASHIVEVTMQHPRLAPSPLETRSIAARYNDPAEAETLTIWLSTQTPHRSRDFLATMLGVDKQKLRMIAPDVGGAFGMKASLYPEEVLVAWAALRLQRSVRWQATRSEDFLAAAHGRGACTQGRLAVAADGRFLGLQAQVRCPLGYWLPNSAAIPAWNAARILPGPYRCDAVQVATEASLSHTAPVGIYRGAGRPEAAALMERLVEKAARATGLDALEIRRRNVIPPEQMPWRGPTGITIDSGRYAQTLAQLAREADYAGLRQTVQARRAAGELVGLGAALYIEPCGQGWESARVQVEPDGRIIAATGGSAQGQSRVAVLAGIVAREFGVDPAAIEVRIGDTASCPAGIGALASRSTAIGGSAMLQAARQAHEQLLADTSEARTATITADVVYEAPGEAWGYGCYLAVVAIDGDTGKVRCEHLHVVDDIGTVLDKALVRDQILGGIAQGVGEALLEQVVYDEHGQLLTGSLMDYALPRADDMPTVSISTLNTPSPFNELGAKGVGEAGTIGAPAAIANAVQDALAALTAQDLPMPFTPQRIWQVMHSANLQESTT